MLELVTNVLKSIDAARAPIETADNKAAAHNKFLVILCM